MVYPSCPSCRSIRFKKSSGSVKTSVWSWPCSFRPAMKRRSRKTNTWYVRSQPGESRICTCSQLSKKSRAVPRLDIQSQGQPLVGIQPQRAQGVDQRPNPVGQPVQAHGIPRGGESDLDCLPRHGWLSKTGINGKSTGGGFILSHCMMTATHAETIEGSYNWGEIMIYKPNQRTIGWTITVESDDFINHQESENWFIIPYDRDITYVCIDVTLWKLQTNCPLSRLHHAKTLTEVLASRNPAQFRSSRPTFCAAKWKEFAAEITRCCLPKMIVGS